VQIGTGGGSQFFSGVIDEVRMWQGALTDREVANLYAA
jgi:hypothetical protein